MTTTLIITYHEAHFSKIHSIHFHTLIFPHVSKTQQPRTADVLL